MAESEWIKRDLLGRSQSWLSMRLYIWLSNGVYLKKQYPVPELVVSLQANVTP